MESETINGVGALVAEQVRASNTFSEVVLVDVPTGVRVDCAAVGSPSPVWYRAVIQPDVCVVEFTTADRWLSQSVEADLVNTGDTLEELLEEELVEHGYESSSPRFEHFRSDDLEYVFRVTIKDAHVSTIVAFLLSFDSCFARLGDVRESGA